METRLKLFKDAVTKMSSSEEHKEKITRIRERMKYRKPNEHIAKMRALIKNKKEE